MVMLVLAKSASTLLDARCKAFTNTSAVSCPVFANVRNLPTGTSSPVAIAAARLGAFSITELNSSPRNAPLANACPNWVNAALALSALAPLMAMALFTVSVMPSVSCWLMPNCLALAAKRWYTLATPSKFCPVRVAMFNSSLCAVCNSWLLAVTSFRRLLNSVHLSIICAIPATLPMPIAAMAALPMPLPWLRLMRSWAAIKFCMACAWRICAAVAPLLRNSISCICAAVRPMARAWLCKPDSVRSTAARRRFSAATCASMRLRSSASAILC